MREVEKDPIWDAAKSEGYVLQNTSYAKIYAVLSPHFLDILYFFSIHPESDN